MRASPVVIGEICNFAAYAFAPAILVTPLGALSVLVGAILGSYFLDEILGTLGKLGSAICLIGAVIIVLHAPPDEEITTIDQILEYALKPGEHCRSPERSCTANRLPGFLIYSALVTAYSVVAIYKIAPVHGKKNPLIYLSICSLVGSVSVMAVKAFGIALKLTFSGNNQFSHPSTYVFIIITVVAILTQMNYFNKALSQFPANMCVSPPRRRRVAIRLTMEQCKPFVLCDLHHGNALRLLHPVQRLQHHRSCQHAVPPLRLPGDLYRGLPPQPIAERPRRHPVSRKTGGPGFNGNRHGLEHPDPDEHGSEEKHGAPPQHQQQRR